MGQNVSEAEQEERDRAERKRIITEPQHPPKKGLATVRSYIVEAMEQHKNHPFAVVFEDCLLKLDAGQEEYGSPLETFNTRSADRDAYQDLIDSINYQAQGLMEATRQTEINARANDLVETLRIATRIRKRLIDGGLLQ